MACSRLDPRSGWTAVLLGECCSHVIRRARRLPSLCGLKPYRMRASAGRLTKIGRGLGELPRSTQIASQWDGRFSSCLFLLCIIRGKTGYTHSVSPSRPPNNTLNTRQQHPGTRAQQPHTCIQVCCGYLCIFSNADGDASSILLLSSFFWKVVVLQDGLLLLSPFTYLLVGAHLDESTRIVRFFEWDSSGGF